MSKHTPGPWSAHINGSRDGNDPVLGHETDCSEQGFVAHTVCFGAGDVLFGEVSAYKYSVDGDFGYKRVADFAENIANARLIASAPELLDALQRLMGATIDMQDAIEAGRQARAAIFKATGEEA